MSSKPVPVYEDLEVRTELSHEAEDDSLTVRLPGLKISGQRAPGYNKVGRFSKEVPFPSNCDQNRIRVNFKDETLHVKYPRLIVPAEKQEEEEEVAKPSGQVPKPDQKPAPQPPTTRPAEATPQKHKNGPEQAAVQGDPPKVPMEKETGEKKDDGVAKQILDGWSLMGLKNPSKMMNKVLAVLLVMVLAVYIRKAIRFPSLGNDMN